MVTYLLITGIIFFGHAEDLLGTTLLSRPLVLGPLVGLVLGDWQQGVIIGASLELIFMGNIKVGAAIPPDVVTGGALGTAFALLSGKGTGIALALAIPISILAEMLLSALFVVRSSFNKLFERYAEEGDWRGIQRLHVLSGFLKPVLMALVGWLALQLGADTMKSLLNHIPDWVNTGLQVAGNLLPALGFALLMNLLFQKRVAPYFFLGFLLAAYLKLPMIAIGGLGVIIAILVTGGQRGEGASDGSGSDGSGAVADIIHARDLRKVFWRSMLLEANFNFETMQNTGFVFAMLPILKKLYRSKEAMGAALRRHLQLFNTSTYGCTLILGLTTAMEVQNSRDEEFNDGSINAVKSGLMGPLAGVFDSLFWGTLRVIAAGVGTSMALKGNPAGPILFILIFNIPHLVLRYNLTFIGYRAGTKFLQRLTQNNVMDRLKDGAAILGLMVVGAMPAALMNLHTPVSFGEGTSLQGILDQIVPAALPLGLTFLTWYFLQRGVKTTTLLLGLLVLGFIGSIIHVLS